MSVYLPHKVKTQYVHFKSHAEYFLLPWKMSEEISRRSMLFNITKGSIYYSKHMYIQPFSSVHILDYTQVLFWKLLKKLVGNQCSSITKGSICTYNLLAWKWIGCLMEVSTLFYICTYCLFTLWARYAHLEFSCIRTFVSRVSQKCYILGILYCFDNQIIK